MDSLEQWLLLLTKAGVTALMGKPLTFHMNEYMDATTMTTIQISAGKTIPAIWM